jgi:soluble lytic murein transglycosylase
VFRFAGILLLLSLLACSGRSEHVFNGKSQKSKTWGAGYASARDRLMSDRASACTELVQLSHAPATAIAPLAEVRVLESCRSDAAALSQLENLFLRADLAWLRPQALQSLVSLAIKLNDTSRLVDYALDRARQLGSQQEKELLLLRALQAARDLGWTVEASRIEDELFRIAPRQKPNPPPAEWYKAAEDFRVNEDWGPAESLYERIYQAPGFLDLEKFRALGGLREIQKAKFRFYGGALDAFLQASDRASSFAEAKLRSSGNLSFDDRRVYYEGWLQYARDEWSYGDIAVALGELQRLLGFSGLELPFRAHGLWTLARVYANTGDWLASAENGEKSARLLENDLPNASAWSKWQWTLWDDSFWMAALAHRKIQDWTAASSLLDLALRHTQNPNSEIKFSFWLALCLKDQGVSTVAESYFRQLMVTDPFGFYGFLAHRELNESLGELPNLDLENPPRPSGMSTSDFDLLVDLVYAGELNLAQLYAQPRLDPNSTDRAQLLVRAFVHDYNTIQSIYFARIAPADRNAFVAQYARLFYPEPFAETVGTAVLRNPRVDKEYVYSIMRQESAFNPLSHSWANAYGLLQILPQVARDVMAKAGVNFTEDFELYRPEINIPVGVAHMDNLIDMAGTSFILRTASYNATLEKTLEWRQRLFNGNVYEFMEEIPYDETRSYVRLVMRNYIMNLRLNATAPIPFPEHLLDL